MRTKNAMSQIRENLTDETGFKRTPRQERGYLRVKQILDAAASLITEHGAEQLTIQNLSKAAQTSPGSLYHFFPDLNAVIRALSERHEESISAIIQGLENTVSQDEWRDGNAHSFIRRLFSPYEQYLLGNRDYLPVLQLRGFTFEGSGFLDFMKKVMQLRYPQWDEDKVISEAVFLHAIATGVLQQAFRREENMAYEFIPGIFCVLELYLSHLETESLNNIAQV
ncbi:MAG: TetR/AcrR family transcriptional regulator [Rouxiella aceris]|uniref:TetR/AcrR family transcriptional regulator n=1 Tax=Rouxiella aceris TaxID=2703884 RepID=UPI0028487A28|nr:TetR/AcrR family transcriptional regulator [Rouxiella aceris]MDR3432111.1 TetR/AcrR family transcriptional regulator [Rouxiella aceris]